MIIGITAGIVVLAIAAFILRAMVKNHQTLHRPRLSENYYEDFQA